MTAKERTLWEQAERVLRQNEVSSPIPIELHKAEWILAKARERAASSQRKIY